MVSRKPTDLSVVRAECIAYIKSQLFNILRANPSLSRIYNPADISAAVNSPETIDLAKRYQKTKRYIPMPHHPNTRVCTHVKVTGHQCGSPALRGEQFCYFHQRMMRGVPTPPDARMHPIALIENEEAIQASIMEVINALARNTIDTRRAELILRALHIAVKNAGRTKFHHSASEMVREVPDYPAPDAPPAHPEMDSPGELAAHVTAVRLLREAGVSLPAAQVSETEAKYPPPILARSWEAML
jgi:hypothetical protein